LRRLRRHICTVVRIRTTAWAGAMVASIPQGASLPRGSSPVGAGSGHVP
jgi:hypothetical protein